MFDVSNHAALDQQLHEPEDIRMFAQQVPVEPTRVVVLAVGVVVAALATPHLIAHDEHGHTTGQHQRGEEVLYLSVAKPLDYGIVRRTFNAAVPAPVLLTSVPVVLTILFVVLVVIRDDIVERKSVVARNEVDALFEFALLRAINARAAQQTIGSASHGIIGAPEEVADIVAKPVVPLLPTVTHEVADLIESCGVPCFRDHLG